MRLRCNAVVFAAFAVAVSSSSLAGPAPIQRARVVVYDGHGSPAGFEVRGRVLVDRGLPRASADDGAGENLRRTINDIDSDELRGVDLTVTVAGVGYGATTDADGVFKVRVKGLVGPVALPVGALPVEATLSSSFATADAARGVVHVAPPTGLALVSDIDDTVVKTFVTDKRRMAREVLLKNARQLEPVEGAAAAYARARTSGVDAVFYVSSSPQNLYDRLTSYLRERGFPAGTLFLKNLGEDALFGHDDYKLEQLERIARAHPGLRFVLSGDSGERDPEIYREFRRRHPDRVVAIVMRVVPGSKDLSAARFADMITVDDRWPDDGVIVRALASASASSSSSP
jgi:phosphatidate phosphatase APP1